MSKIDYEYIAIKNISIHNNSKIEFGIGKKVFPIIGLNGSGKSIFLELLSELKSDKYFDEYEQKFVQAESTTEPLHQCIFIKLENELILSNQGFSKELREIIAKDFAIAIEEDGYKLKFNKILKICSYKKYKGKKFYFVPVFDENDNNSIEFFEKNINNNKKHLSQFSNEIMKLLKSEVMNFTSLSLEKEHNHFLEKDKTKLKTINILTEMSDEDVYHKILDKSYQDWKKELKKYLKELTKDNGAHKGQGLEANKIRDEINRKINSVITGENDTEERKVLLNNIFNNLSGRKHDGTSTFKPIKTIPKIHLDRDYDQDDFYIDVFISEEDINGNFTDFDVSDKNDGFNLIFWYIIFTKFLIDEIDDHYILIDEFGNFLNPKVISNFIELLSIQNHKTVFTSHNPYTINSKMLNSIHICARNRNDNFAGLSHIKNWNRNNLSFDKFNPIKDETFKIIHDALAIQDQLLDWKIDQNKTNLFIEGVSDMIAFKIFLDNDNYKPLVIIGAGNVYHVAARMICEDDVKFEIVVDKDWDRGSTGSKGFRKGELENLNKYIKKLDEFDKLYWDIEDLFIYSDLNYINNFFEKHSIEKTNLKNIDAHLIEELKELIVKELFEILHLSKDEIISRDKNYENTYDTFKKIIIKIEKQID